MLTEAHGILLALVVEAANRPGMKLAEATLTDLMVPRPLPTPDKPQGLCLDKGYNYEAVRELVAGLGFTLRMCAAGAKNNATFANWATALGAGWSNAHTAG